MASTSPPVETSDDAANRRTREIFGICCGLGAALLWGIQPVVSRYGVLRSLNAYDLAAIRFFVSGLILAPVLFRLGLRGITWFGASMIAVGAGLGYVLFFNLGLTFSTASNGVLSRRAPTSLFPRWDCTSWRMSFPTGNAWPASF